MMKNENQVMIVKNEATIMGTLQVIQITTDHRTEGIVENKLGNGVG